jgi:hypothetical protein
MEQLATPGIILLTAEKLRLAEGFVQVNASGPIPVEGLTEPVEVFELVGVTAVRRRLQATACARPHQLCRAGDGTGGAHAGAGAGRDDRARLARVLARLTNVFRQRAVHAGAFAAYR